MGRRIEFQAVLARGDSECRSAAVSSCGYSDLVVSRAAAPPKKIVAAGPAAVVPESCAPQCRWCTVCDLETFGHARVCGCTLACRRLCSVSSDRSGSHARSISSAESTPSASTTWLCHRGVDRRSERLTCARRSDRWRCIDQTPHLSLGLDSGDGGIAKRHVPYHASTVQQKRRHLVARVALLLCCCSLARGSRDSAHPPRHPCRLVHGLAACRRRQRTVAARPVI